LREIQDRREATANRIQDRRDAAARDFEARKEAKNYYRELYGKIAILDELMRGYQRSIKDGKADVFSVKDCARYIALAALRVCHYAFEHGFYSLEKHKKRCSADKLTMSFADFNRS